MDFFHDHIEEDSKYAFLLGSALRNDGPEQVLNIYDNLIPQYISDKRLEKIKEEARHFADLPEAEFNALVLQARTFSLASGRRSCSPPFTSTTTGGSVNSSSFSMSGPQQHGSGWSVSNLPTLADDTSLLEQNGVEDAAEDEDGCCLSASSPDRRGLGLDTTHTSKSSPGLYASGKRTVTNHFAPQQQQAHHHHTFLSSSPKHEGYDPARYSDSSSLTGSGCFTTLVKDKPSYGLSAGKPAHPYVNHDDVKLDLDRVLTSSADEDSGLPPSSSSHKASSDGRINSFPSDDDSQDSDEEEEGDDEERQSLLHSGVMKTSSGRVVASKDSNRHTRERSLVRVTATYPNPSYDEEVALNTSTGSSEYVESPRSDAEENNDGSSSYSKSRVPGGGVEMNMLSYRETPHAADRRSPDNIHKLLFSNRSSRRMEREVWDYSENSRRCQQDDEDDDDDDDDDDFPRGGAYESQRGGAWGGSCVASTGSIGTTSTSGSFAVPTQVDTKIPFLGPSSASSAMMYGGAQYSYNLGSAGAARKAKPKKGRSKDDSDKLDQSQATGLDVNGNPSPLSPSVYSQMRQFPYSSSSSVQHSNSSSTGTTATSISSGGHGGAQTAGSESELTKRQKRRDSKLNKQKTYQVQYDDLKFKDDTSIDEILSFIQQPEGGGKNTVSSAKAGKGKKQGTKKQGSQEVVVVEEKVEPAKVPGKKKATKKDNLVLNGQLSTEETELGDYVITLKAMGNSVSAQGDNEEKSSPSIKDFEETTYRNDADLANEDTVKTNKDLKVLEKEVKKQPNFSLKENNLPKVVGKEEISGQKEPAEGNTKTNNNRKAKSKQAVVKKEVTDSAPKVNGPLSPPLTMVKSNQSSVDDVEKLDTGLADQQTNLDLELVPKKEEVFVEVKKKKKRAGPKDNTGILPSSNAPFVPNQFYSRPGNNGVPGQGGFRNSSYQRQPRSCVPVTFPPSSTTTTSLASSTMSTTYTTNATSTPIVSSSNTTLSISSNSSSSSGVDHSIHPPRDLSPSAFPVLETHSLPPTGTEARRNSCGDASDLLVESKSLCDSDRESVKSLPATSPLYPISYARMAAASGPRRNNNSSYPESIASPSSESGLGWQNSSNSSVTHTPTTTSPGGIAAPHTPERKASTAVWKGSPRERRHSIGSSPAEEKLSSPGGEESSDTASVARNRQKSGSQEFLNRDLSSVSSSPSSEVKVAVVKPFQTSESSSSLQSEPNISKDVSSSDVKVTNTSAQYATTPVIPVPCTSAPSKKADSVTSVPSQLPTGQKNIGDESVDSSVGKKIITSTNKNSSSSSTSSRTSTSASSGNNSKSVVFLDKRFTSTPGQSLGITFGFDSTYDSDSTVQKKEEKVSEKSSNVIHPAPVAASVSSSISSSSTCSTSLAPSSEQASSSRPHNIPPSTPTVPSSSGAPAQQSVSASASDKKVPKGPHIERLPNGLVAPPPHSQHGQGQPITASSIVSNTVPPQVRPGGSNPVVGPGLVVPFNPSCPPPPLPQGHTVLSNPAPPLVLPPATGSTPLESQDYRKLSCLPDVSQPPPVPTLKGAGPAPLQHHHQSPQQHKLEAIPVVYGLKIKPNGGCGKLLFVPPPNLVKKLRPKEVTEASGFLKKRWTGVNEPVGKNSILYDMMKGD